MAWKLKFDRKALGKLEYCARETAEGDKQAILNAYQAFGKGIEIEIVEVRDNGEERL